MSLAGPLARSHGLWAETAPPAPPAPPLAGEVRADVAVVGAGYTGLSAALHLAEAGARAVVLEAAAVGQGGSGRNVGLVNAGLWLPPDVVEARLGPDLGPRLLAALGAGPALVWELVARHDMRCEAVRNGTLHCAVGARGLAALSARAAQWQARGAPVRLIDADETAARTGTKAYAGALLDARAGTIQPLAYARELARAAAAAGAAIHGESPVRALAAAPGGWRLEVPGGSVTAAQVIVATNAYSGPPWDALRGEIAHLPYFNIATAPMPEAARARILPGGEGCWDTPKLLTSFRRDAAGRLILGSVGALQGLEGAAHRGWARRVLRRLFPEIGNLPFEQEWFGMIGTTPDALPRFHRLAPGVLAVAGYNGRGIAPGTVFGRALARIALGAEAEAELPLPARPPVPFPSRRLTEAAQAGGAALAHLFAARLG